MKSRVTQFCNHLLQQNFEVADLFPKTVSETFQPPQIVGILFFSRVWWLDSGPNSTTLNLQLLFFERKNKFFGRLMKPPDKHHQRRSLRGKFLFFQRWEPLGSWDNLEQTTRVTSRNSHKHGPFSPFFSSSLGRFFI